MKNNAEEKPLNGYIKQTDYLGRPLDVNGNRIIPKSSMKPSHTPEAHIPAEKFKYKPSK